MEIEALPEIARGADFSGLCRLLAECVRGGASIGFVDPLPEADVEAYWDGIAGEVAAGSRLILVAREVPGGPVLGSAQLGFQQKKNGRHRAEVQKVLVLPSQRRKGIASELMAALETAARRRSVSLLHLDTSEGAGGAEGLYRALGYSYVGGIPGYALDPDGTPVKNAIYYKELM
jgi:acetyltransferase